MQFYLNGYKAGDPFIEDPHPCVAERPGGLPGDADVLIIGCGPAGLVLAAQMANFPDIRTVVIDRKDGPLEVGQADGVACRTVELLEAFGLADRLVNEGYWVNEVAFWRPDPQDRTKITRTGRIQDVQEGLSEMPHVIVNQARMLAYLLDHMERSASKLRPFYGLHAGESGSTPAARRSTRWRSPCGTSRTPRRPAKPRRSGRSTSSAATARAASPGRRSAANCAGTR